MNKQAGITKYLLWIILGFALGVWVALEFLK